MNAQPQCPECGRAFQPGRTVCMWCGADLSEVAPPEQILTCAGCGERLQEAKGEGWTLHQCETCRGIWMTTPCFERLETMLRETARRLPSEEHARRRREARPDPAAGLEDAALRGGRIYRNCPQCGGQMARRRYRRISKVVIDECLGHGVWFDAGEFQTVVEFLKTGGAERAEEFLRNEAAAEALARSIENIRKLGHSGSGFLTG